MFTWINPIVAYEFSIKFQWAVYFELKNKLWFLIRKKNCELFYVFFFATKCNREWCVAISSVATQHIHCKLYVYKQYRVHSYCTWHTTYAVIFPGNITHATFCRYVMFLKSKILLFFSFCVFRTFVKSTFIKKKFFFYLFLSFKQLKKFKEIIKLN